jgi:adenine deaminase
MLCSDDKHPDSLLEGHINTLCARAVAKGIDPFNVLKAACINPVLHYKLPTGLLREGDPANLVVLKDLSSFEVIETYINGEMVAKNGTSYIEAVPEKTINQFNATPLTANNIEILIKDYPSNNELIPVIEAVDGQLITHCIWEKPLLKQDKIVSDPSSDILKIVVYNRYFKASPKIAFIKNFGFKHGAIASTVAHDSHNIIAVGVSDEEIITAINLVIAEQGGISCINKNTSAVLGLPVAGLMTNKDPYDVAAAYTKIDKMAKALGSNLGSPFMTLSFMALLVIPHLKLSDKGLFDGDGFKLF